ncbi:MAG: hypothetical protein WCB12_09825 [Bryobacteraceae bacterium]
MRCTVLFLLSAAGLLADDIIAYDLSGYYHQFGTADLTTGVVSPTGALEQLETGLGVYNGSLYTASASDLYNVNTSTGSLTAPIDPFGVHMLDLGSTLSGLYGVGYGTGDGSSMSDLGLYSINASTGLTTLVGLTRLSYTAGEYVSLSTNSSTLYYGDANELYTIATTTGLAVAVGSFGGSGSYQMEAMTMINGVLYGADANSKAIDTINIGTGLATLGPTSAVLYGLAPKPLPTTPEPGSWRLLAVGIAGLMVAKRMRADQTRRYFLRTSTSTPPTTVRPGIGTPKIS